MSASVGLQQKAAIQNTNSEAYGAVAPLGTETNLYIEGDGLRLNAQRAWLPINSNRLAPAHGTASQHAVGQNITGSYMVPLHVSNRALLTGGDDYVTRDGTTGKLDQFSIAVDKTNSEIKEYTGLKVDTCEISASPGEVFRMNWDLIGADEVDTAGNITIGLPTVGAFYPHWAMTFSWDAITSNKTIEDISISIANNLVPGPHKADNGTFDNAIIAYLEPTVQEVTGSFTALFDPAITPDWQADIRSSSEDFAPFILTLNDGSGTSANSLIITIPQAYISDANEEGSTGDLIKVSVNFQASYDGSGDIITFANGV